MKSKAGVEFTIKGHTAEAVLSEMRPLLSKHGVDITPNLVERTYTGNRCDVLIDFLFERTDDSDEQRTIRWAGAGTDEDHFVNASGHHLSPGKPSDSSALRSLISVLKNSRVMSGRSSLSI